jgi:ribokinase
LTRARRRRAVALLSGVFLTPKLRQSYGRLIEEVAALGYEVALDTGWPSGDWNDPLREEVFAWASKCDHVLLNEIELASLSKQTDDLASLRYVGQRLKPGAHLIVKNGARGAVGWRNGVVASAQAIPSTVFDTIGAGDSFNTGYLLAHAGGQDLGSALEAGCKAAASVITRFPRRLIKRGEFADQLAWPAWRVGQTDLVG